MPRLAPQGPILGSSMDSSALDTKESAFEVPYTGSLGIEPAMGLVEMISRRMSQESTILRLTVVNANLSEILWSIMLDNTLKIVDDG